MIAIGLSSNTPWARKMYWLNLLNEPYRKIAFAKVDEFGRNMFSALQIFNKKSGFMRYLVVYWIVSFYFRNVTL